jgi:hypothetical protein
LTDTTTLASSFCLKQSEDIVTTVHYLPESKRLRVSISNALALKIKARRPEPLASTVAWPLEASSRQSQ